MPQKNGEKMTWKDELRKAPFDVNRRQREAEEKNVAKLYSLLEKEVDPILGTSIDTGARKPYRVTLDRNIIRDMIRLAGGDKSDFLDAMSGTYNTNVYIEEPRLTGGPSTSGLKNMQYLVFDDPMVQ
tara:strand:+ start:110 stop:490 length:381 start_codon:yes stop_codon:yes gene_type:complete